MSRNGTATMSTRAREAFADALGVNLGSGCFVSRTKDVVVQVMDGFRLTLAMDYSHSIVGTGYQLGCWKVSGDLYIAVAYEEDRSLTTVLVMDKARYRALGGKTPPNLCDFVYQLSGDKKIETLDDYIAEMNFMTVGLWMRKNLEETWSRLDEDDVIEA